MIVIFVAKRMNKILIDTNIIVYSKDSSSDFHQDSLRFVNSPGVELFTTSKNLSEYFAVVTKGIKPLLSPLEALQDIEEIVARFEILYPSKLSLQKMIELVANQQPTGLKIHDFEIISIALANGIYKICTLNKNDFKTISEVQIIGLTDI